MKSTESSSEPIFYSVSEKNTTVEELLEIKDDLSNFLVMFSDLHIHEFFSYGSYINQCKNFLNKISSLTETLAKNNLNASMAFLGDLFDSAYPSKEALILAFDFMNNGQEILLVSGNHVKSNYLEKDPVSMLHYFAGADNNSKYFLEPTCINRLGINFLILPFHPDYKTNPDKITEDLATILPSGEDKLCPNIILSHIPLKGAKFDNGVMSEFGVVIETEHLDVASPSLFMLGDYHTPQRIEGIDYATYYCGAPFQFNFGHKFTPCFRVLQIKHEEQKMILHTIETSSLMGDDFVEFRVEKLETTADIKRVYDNYLDEDVQDKVRKNLNLRIDGYRNTKTDRAVALLRSIHEDKINIMDQRKSYKVKTTVGNYSDTADIREFIRNEQSIKESNLVNDFVEFVFHRSVSEDEDNKDKLGSKEEIMKSFKDFRKLISYDNL